MRESVRAKEDEGRSREGDWKASAAERVGAKGRLVGLGEAMAREREGGVCAIEGDEVIGCVCCYEWWLARVLLSR